MTPQRMQVDDDQQKPGGEQSRKQAENAEIPHLCRVQPNHARGALRQAEREQYAQRGGRAVSRDQNRSNVKENGMHFKTG
jgi:hypothetical protein